MKCECGASEPHVGFVKAKIKSVGGQYFIGCTRCGRVGMHGRTEKEAIEHWEKKDYFFKEDK